MKKFLSLLLILLLTTLSYADITPLPDPPSRTSPSTFAAKADAFLGALPAFATEANQLAVDVNADEVAAAASAAAALGYSNIALSSANFAGDWEDQAGAAAPPYAVWHAGNYWQLVNTVLDVSATEPGQTADWRVIGDKITVSTIADLRLISGVSTSSAYLIGHTSANDGGHGVFYWDSDSVLSDNGGTIVQVTGVTTGRWVRQLSGFVTPEMFGITGDGSDESQKWESMLDSCQNVEIHNDIAKTYFVPTLSATHGFKIRGNDRNKCILDFGGSGSFYITNETSAIVDIEGITITNAYIGIGNTPVPDGTVNDIETIRARGCKFSTISKSGIDVRCNSIKNVVIEDNIFENIAGSGDVTGVRIGTQSADDPDDRQKNRISNNIFRNISSTSNGVHVQAIISFGKELIIEGNFIDTVYNADYGDNASGIYVKSRWTRITGNIIKDAGYGLGAITIKGRTREEPPSLDYSQSGYGSIVSFNQIIFTSTTHRTRGIYCRSSDISIFDNYIEGAFYGITQTEDIGAANGLVDGAMYISRNKMIRCTRAGIYITQYGGLLEITDNTIKDLTGSALVTTATHGIYAIGTRNYKLVKLSGNTISISQECTSAEATGIQVHPASSAGTIEALSIVNNNVINDGTGVKYGVRLNLQSYISNLLIAKNTLDMTAADNYKIHWADTSRPASYLITDNGVADAGNGRKSKFTAEYSWDSSMGGSGSVVIGHIPLNAVVTKTTLRVVESLAGSGNFGISHTDAQLISSAIYSSFTAGWYDGIQTGAVATYATKAGNDRPVTVNMTGTITSGSVRLYLEYCL